MEIIERFIAVRVFVFHFMIIARIYAREDSNISILVENPLHDKCLSSQTNARMNAPMYDQHSNLITSVGVLLLTQTKIFS